MALPNSPFAQHSSGAPKQMAQVAPKPQHAVSNVRRVIGNNVKSGYSLPPGAGFLRTQISYSHVSKKTVAVHTYLYQGKIVNVKIGVQTQRHGTVTPIKLEPQKVAGF